MEPQDVKIVLDKENKEVVIRTGEALPLAEQQKIVVIGTIDAPAKWHNCRRAVIAPLQCVIIVSRDAMKIEFIENMESLYCHKITGVLQTSTEFRNFGINGSKQWNPAELSDFIRMNRSCFSSLSDAMNLITSLRNFTANVQKTIEDKDDKRGNTDLVRRQAVETNLPKAFMLKIPLFKGGEKTTIKVEIDVNPSNLQMSLVSPDAKDTIDTTSDEIINSEIAKFDPEIPVLEV